MTDILRLTQTVTGLSGNCWQTAVACILGVPAERLPPQAEYPDRCIMPDGSVGWTSTGGYLNPLQAYLRTHHGLAYLQLHAPEELFSSLRPAEDVPHMIIGRTERSDSLGGLQHVVVGMNGKMVWDPHPSRAGLTGEIQWAFLIPFPKAWKGTAATLVCVCPACRVGAL